jgi:hypothetical protein
MIPDADLLSGAPRPLRRDLRAASGSSAAKVAAEDTELLQP